MTAGLSCRSCDGGQGKESTSEVMLAFRQGVNVIKEAKSAKLKNSPSITFIHHFEELALSPITVFGATVEYGLLVPSPLCSDRLCGKSNSVVAELEMRT